MLHLLAQKPSVLSQFIAELRDVQVQKDRHRFRLNMQRCGQIMAYEISKSLSYETIELTTEYGIATSQVIEEVPVLATILRAGLPLHNGFLDYFDNSDCAFVSTFRKTHKSGEFETKVEYSTIPNCEGKTLIISDPMLATGNSMVLTAKEIIAKGGMPKQIHFATIIACNEGIELIKKSFPKAHIWSLAVDEELTSQSYIVPGLGAAGDLAYGEK